MGKGKEALKIDKKGRLRGPTGQFASLQAPAREKQGALDVRNAALETAKGPLRPSQCAPYLRRELAHSFRGIVSGFVTQAKSGSVPHMKETMHLLEDSGVSRKRKGSSRSLVDELERMTRESAGTGDPDGPGGPDPGDVWRE